MIESKFTKSYIQKPIIQLLRGHIPVLQRSGSDIWRVKEWGGGGVEAFMEAWVRNGQNRSLRITNGYAQNLFYS